MAGWVTRRSCGRTYGYGAGRPRRTARIPSEPGVGCPAPSLLEADTCGEVSEAHCACARGWPAQNCAPRGRAGSMPSAWPAAERACACWGHPRSLAMETGGTPG